MRGERLGENWEIENVKLLTEASHEEHGDSWAGETPVINIYSRYQQKPRIESMISV